MSAGSRRGRGFRLEPVEVATGKTSLVGAKSAVRLRRIRDFDAGCKACESEEAPSHGRCKGNHARGQESDHRCSRAWTSAAKQSLRLSRFRRGAAAGRKARGGASRGEASGHSSGGIAGSAWKLCRRLKRAHSEAIEAQTSRRKSEESEKSSAARCKSSSQLPHEAERGPEENS